VLGDTLRADPVLGQSDPRHVSVDYLRRPDGRERYDALCRAAARLGRQMRRVRARSATGESVGFPAMWGSGVAKDSPAATARANGAGVAV